jgi:L-amino acid N-acyltransferase YncA
MIIKVRKALVKDLKAITEIYNEAVLKTDATFDNTPKTLKEQREWFDEHGPHNPVLVADADGKVQGWASLSQWSSRCAYAATAEISIYIKEEHRNQGIGKLLMQAILDAGDEAGLHTVISRITGGNQVSVRLHEKFGFKHIGVMREVGNKFGRMLDVIMMQKIYG